MYGTLVSVMSGIAPLRAPAQPYIISLCEVFLRRDAFIMSLLTASATIHRSSGLDKILDFFENKPVSPTALPIFSVCNISSINFALLAFPAVHYDFQRRRHSPRL
jgi:hypothetical protein